MLKGHPVAGIDPQMNVDMPPWWTSYVSVDDADESAARIVAEGGQVVAEPMNVLDAGRMAVALDRFGADQGVAAVVDVEGTTWPGWGILSFRPAWTLSGFVMPL